MTTTGTCNDSTSFKLSVNDRILVDDKAKENVTYLLIHLPLIQHI